MTMSNRLFYLAFAATLGALSSTCATAPQPPPRTIEPPSNDTVFVLSREPTGAKPVESRGPVHINDAWWAFRASHLKVTEAEVKEREAAISEKEPPLDFWDPQTSAETIAIWSEFCNECHGGRRKREDVLKMPAPSPTWGKGEGLFFGARRAYTDIFRTISHGKIEKEGNRYRMPAWKGKLAKEQIWALMYFVEYQSGGIEGRFPPSLYPRGDSLEGER